MFFVVDFADLALAGNGSYISTFSCLRLDDFSISCWLQEENYIWLLLFNNNLERNPCSKEIKMYLLANCGAKLLIRFRVHLIMILKSIFITFEYFYYLNIKNVKNISYNHCFIRKKNLLSNFNFHL